MNNQQQQKQLSSSLGRFEGCGELGLLRSIFFAEFHPVAGPMIRCQAPSKGDGAKDIVTKEMFEAVSCFIIPKPQLDRTPMTVNVQGRKICGYPVVLQDEKYKRNQFMFNVCFVCHPWSRTVQYEPALIKLSNFLKDLELDSEFLYNEFNNEALQDILEKVFRDLNAKGECSVRALNYTLELKVISIAPDPPQVNDWDVPMLMVNVNVAENENLGNKSEEWDLTTQQILVHIDGVLHVKRIANEAGVDSSLVKAAIQNLLYHRVVALVPIFLYSNTYCLTPKLKDLRDPNKLSLRKEFMEFIKRDPEDPPQTPAAAPASPTENESVVTAGDEDTKHISEDNNVEIATKKIVENLNISSPAAEVPQPPPSASFKDVYKMVCEFNNHSTVQDICLRYRPRLTMNIDEIRLVQYLILKKILRKVYKYPVYVQDVLGGSLGANTSNNTDNNVQGAACDLYHLFTGNKHFDEICCRLGMSVRQLEELIDNDPNVYVIRQ